MALATGALGYCLVSVPAAGGAPSAFTTGFADPLYVSGSNARAEALEATARTDAGIARLTVNWRATTSGVPADPADPADPAYNFVELDGAVRDLSARGLDVLLTLYSAPDFAVEAGAPAGVTPGAWKPEPTAFGQFAEAVASRYSGDFAGLPRVRIFQAWNEQNLSIYLSPQFEGGEHFAAEHYRSMLTAFDAGVKRVHADNLVVTGGTAPYGDPPGGPRTRPVAFWRHALCLSGDTCRTQAAFDVLAHHPINTSGGPRRSALHPQDASTPDLHVIGDVLRKAEAKSTIQGPKRHRIWATEIWWDTDPPDMVEGVPLRRHARWIAEAFYVLWRQGASVVVNLQVMDLPFDPGNAHADTSTGVFFADGRPKPALTAFRFPFVVDRRKSGLIAWGVVPESGRLRIQQKVAGSRWRTVRSLRVDDREVFETQLRRGDGRFRAMLEGVTSLVWAPR